MSKLWKNAVKKLKYESGITLIALIVTLTVMLLLSGISIAVLTGENGIITVAREASFRQDLQKIVENVNLAIFDCEFYGDTIDKRFTRGTL